MFIEITSGEKIYLQLYVQREELQLISADQWKYSSTIFLQKCISSGRRSEGRTQSSVAINMYLNCWAIDLVE